MTPYDIIETICREEPALQAHFHVAAAARNASCVSTEPRWTLEHLDEDGWPGDVVARIGDEATIRLRYAPQKEDSTAFVVVSIEASSPTDEVDVDGYCPAADQALTAVKVLPVLCGYLTARFTQIKLMAAAKKA